MLMNPPIDKLIEMADCQYELACAISDRARQLMVQEQEYLTLKKEKPISVAANELFDGEIIIIKE